MLGTLGFKSQFNLKLRNGNGLDNAGVTGDLIKAGAAEVKFGDGLILNTNKARPAPDVTRGTNQYIKAYIE